MREFGDLWINVKIRPAVELNTLLQMVQMVFTVVSISVKQGLWYVAIAI